MPTSSLGAHRMNFLHEYFFARANEKITALRNQGREIINLGMGNPDLSPPQEVLAALTQASQQPTNHGYPSYTGLTEFRQAISDWYATHYQVRLDTTSEVLPLNGSKQGIFYLSLSLLDKGDQVLVPNPGYSAYEKAASIAGAETIFYSLSAENSWLPDLNALEKMDVSGVKLMWINYPHNPTGATVTKEQLSQIADFARKHKIILVNDNPYSHVVFDGYQSPSLMEIRQPEDLFIELHSMSKTYNMPGWRIGWAVGDADVIGLLKNMYGNIETGQFIPLQYAATVALQTPTSWITERNQLYAERRARVITILKTLHCQIFEPKASLYIWAKLPVECSDSEKFVFDLLEKTGVFLAPGSAFGSGGEGYLRASICQPQEKLDRALDLILQNS
jgi:LL-diaminopimelate aminotransferase